MQVSDGFLICRYNSVSQSFRRPFSMKSYPDSYLHFENLDAPETQNFAAEAHAETRARFLRNDKARELSDGILAQMAGHAADSVLSGTPRTDVPLPSGRGISRRACTACVRRRLTVRAIPSGKSCFRWRISTNCSATMCIWAACRTWWKSPTARC